MGEWRQLRIGDVCDIVRGETGLASGTPGQYPMVATGAERRSCNTYQFDTEAVCIPLVSSTGHGKKTLNYVHYQSGKFALGTILAAVIPKDPKVLTTRYLHLYLSHFKDTVLVPLMKGAANVSLPMKGIASVEIPVPTVKEQQKLIDLIGRIESEHRELLEEGTRQAGLFKQLRQAVLQEAVEGKLTADWSRQHPLVKGDPQHDAAALLAQIKAEKERLVKAGKIRKEKPLPPIADSDKPFELPVGWVWCRLGDVAQNSLGKMLDKTKNKGDYKKCLRNLNVRWFSFDLSDLLEMKFLENETAKYTAEKGDVMICEGGYPGRAAIWPSDEPMYFQKAIHRVRFYIREMNTWFLYFLYLSDLNRYIEKYFTGSGIQHFTGKELGRFVFPLPSLAEQQSIVARVDSLMATIAALEAQVTERKVQAQQLMQAVLREAFAGGDFMKG